MKSTKGGLGGPVVFYKSKADALPGVARQHHERPAPQWAVAALRSAGCAAESRNAVVNPRTDMPNTGGAVRAAPRCLTRAAAARPGCGARRRARGGHTAAGNASRRKSRAARRTLREHNGHGGPGRCGGADEDDEEDE